VKRYRDKNGNTSIAGYQAGIGYIRIRFSDGAQYVYTWRSAGALNIERMKWLALTGDDLMGYIETFVQDRYARKEAVAGRR